jgi:hypothetical protein
LACDFAFLGHARTATRARGEIDRRKVGPCGRCAIPRAAYQQHRSSRRVTVTAIDAHEQRQPLIADEAAGRSTAPEQQANPSLLLNSVSRGPGRIRVNATVLSVDGLTAAEDRRWREVSA